MLSVASEYGKASISGTILIYLKNGKVISLQNKIASDYANDQISVIYTMNTKNINELKESNIFNVRFSYTSPIGDKMGLTARNGQTYFTGMETIQTTEMETAEAIKNLF